MKSVEPPGHETPLLWEEVLSKAKGQLGEFLVVWVSSLCILFLRFSFMSGCYL
jgi:hypothetical protein